MYTGTRVHVHMGGKIASDKQVVKGWRVVRVQLRVNSRIWLTRVYAKSRVQSTRVLACGKQDVAFEWCRMHYFG